jgi:hypothetical protein
MKLNCQCKEYKNNDPHVAFDAMTESLMVKWMRQEIITYKTQTSIYNIRKMR